MSWSLASLRERGVSLLSQDRNRLGLFQRLLPPIPMEYSFNSSNAMKILCARARPYGVLQRSVTKNAVWLSNCCLIDSVTR